MLTLKNRMLRRQPGDSNVTCNGTDWNASQATRENTITIIWVSGCGASVLAYTILLTTALIFKAWRSKLQNKVWIHLCGSYLLFVFSEVIIISFEVPIDVGIVILTLGKYCVQATFCWMLVTAWLAYRNLVRVFPDVATIKNLFTKMSLFAWLVPIPIDLTYYVMLNVLWYNLRNSNNSPEHIQQFKIGLEQTRYYCVVLPAVVISLTNIGFYSRIMYTICRLKDWKNFVEKVRIACFGFLFFLLSGLHWILYVLNIAIRHDICHHVDALNYYAQFLQSYQLFKFCLLFVFGTRETRQMWAQWLQKLIK